MESCPQPFRVAYLERIGRGPERIEERLVERVARQRGLEVVFYTQKQIDRRQLPLADDSFIMGATPAMHGAMKQLGITIPAPNDYPVSLKEYLRRRVWRTGLRDLEERIWEGLPSPVFAKPADRKKDFTGRVFYTRDDLYFLGPASRRQEIWCSDIVEWTAEYRVYVVAQRIVAIDHYEGDAARKLDMALVDEAIHAYGDSGEAPAGYALDFGVLDSGETALVEANDGYSLGVYAADAEPYADLLFARWAELLRGRSSMAGP